MSELKRGGVRVLAYLNPYLVDAAAKPNVTRNLYAEALALGHLVKGADGKPYGMDGFGFPAVQVWVGMRGGEGEGLAEPLTEGGGGGTEFISV